jgi:acetyl esterase
MYHRLWNEASRQGVQVKRDLEYGRHPRHRLDVYLPETQTAPSLPILVFVHGGGFVQGDKSRESNIGYYFARHGIMTVSANYRLAPVYKWPSGGEDMGRVLEWVVANAPQYGGDPDSLFLMGHSAGAAHAATCLFLKGDWSSIQKRNKKSVSGAILLSGPAYDTRRLNPHKDYVYFGKEPSRHPAMSVVRQIEINPRHHFPSILIGFAEFDPPEIEYQALTLYGTLGGDSSNRVWLKRLMGHNHISEIMHINTDDESLGPYILNFINRLRMNPAV